MCSHVDTDAYCFERALQEEKFKLTAAFIALIMLYNNQFMLQLCVCQDIEHLRSLESTQEVRVARGATLTPLSCSPNFPRAQYLDIGTLTHELIVK